MLIRDRYPLSPWQAPNAWDKICHTVVEESVKKERIFTLGHLAPVMSKLIPTTNETSLLFYYENDKTFSLPKFTFLSFSEIALNVILLITLMYEVQIFPKLQPFSIRNDKVL